MNSCDTAFAHYLISFALLVKQTYYKSIVLHLLMLYDCLNKVGQVRLDTIN